MQPNTTVDFEIREIWKYDINIDGSTIISMPKGARIMTIQVQNNIPCMWVYVNPSAEKEQRTFETFYTGEPIYLADREYLGTYQLNNGKLVCHVFEYL